MKLLLISSALVAASFAAPAFANEVSPPSPVVAETPKTVTSVETSVDRTPSATIETKVETIHPVSDRPKLDPETPIAPEVQAVVSSGMKYTTKDIVVAQLEAVKNTPVSMPTTTITTRTTTPTG